VIRARIVCAREAAPIAVHDEEKPIAITYWRSRRGFLAHAFAANTAPMAGGFLLVGYQMTGYFLSA